MLSNGVSTFFHKTSLQHSKSRIWFIWRETQKNKLMTLTKTKFTSLVELWTTIDWKRLRTIGPNNTKSKSKDCLSKTLNLKLMSIWLLIMYGSGCSGNIMAKLGTKAFKKFSHKEKSKKFNPDTNHTFLSSLTL